MITTDPIHESGMIFGPYPDGECYHIENSSVYKRNQEGMKMVEFLLLRDNKLWFVEARSSTPHHLNQKAFIDYIDEIQQKMVNALVLFLGVFLGRHGGSIDTLSREFRAIDFGSLDFKLVVIVKNFHVDGMVQLANGLRSALRPILKAFGIKPNLLCIFNEEMARNKGLITLTGGDS